LHLPINLLLMVVISALFVIFVSLLIQRPSMGDPTVPSPRPKAVTSVKELDSILEELNKEDTTTLINTELNKLSTDASGI